MLHRLIFIFLILAPVLASAQATPGDSEEGNIYKACDDKVFTKSEELPSLKISQQAFEDSLTACLKAHQAFNSNTKVVVQFVLTKDSRIVGLEKIAGSNPDPNFFKCFRQFAKLWSPAVQNTHIVCAYVKCEIQVKQDRVGIRIFQ